jgi:phosphotransferase system HPr (HPr) family protein
LVEFTYTLKAGEGLHARPAGNFVKKAQSYPETITIAKKDQKVDAKRLFSVLKLQAKAGEEIVISVEGANETLVAEQLKSYCVSVL